MALINVGGAYVDAEYIAALLPNKDGTVTVVFNSGAHFPVTLRENTTLDDVAGMFNEANGVVVDDDDADEWKYA